MTRDMDRFLAWVAQAYSEVDAENIRLYGIESKRIRDDKEAWDAGRQSLARELVSDIHTERKQLDLCKDGEKAKAWCLVAEDLLKIIDRKKLEGENV